MITANESHTVGLKSDGTVVAIGKNDDGRCNVSEWKLFDNFDNIEEERKSIAEEKNRIKEQKAAYRSQNLCQHCGGTFKGLFIKKCISCGKEKDY